MSRYNILMIRSEYNLAGPGILVLEYAKELQKRGHKVVACSSGGTLLDEFDKYEIEHIEIPFLAINRRGVSDLVKAILNIRKVIRDRNIDIIHGQNATTTMLSFIASKLIFRRNVRVINTVLGKGKEWFLRILPTPLISVSEDVKQRLIDHGVSQKRVTTLYNGIIDLSKFDVEKYDEREFRKELNIRDDEYLVGSVAMFTGGKGHSEVIESAAQVVQVNPKIKFVLVGTGEKFKQYKDLVDKLGLSNSVLFTGARRDIPNIMSGLDLFVHMPESETFGMVLIEAMAMAKPVIAREVGGIPEVVLDQETGYLVSDSIDLATKIISLIGDENKRKMMGKRGLERVREMFTIEGTVDKLQNLYDNLFVN